MVRSRLALVAIAALCSSFSTAINVLLPNTPPTNSQPLSPVLLSLSIEQDRWPDWTGVLARNEFTHTALLALADLTGQPPKIRVGGDSEDLTSWSPTVSLNEDEFPPPSTITPYPEATKDTVGDDFYALSRFLPRGTHVTWGVNFAADNATNAVNMAKAIVRAFQSTAVKTSGVVLDLIEVGNEADVYLFNGLRSSDWTVEEYVPEWISVAGPVVENVGIHGNSGPVSLQGAAFIGANNFTPSEIFKLGILDSTPGKAISVISQHHYSGAFCDGGDFALASFMSKAFIRGNLSVHEADIAATKEKSLQFILGETNSIGCHGAPGVSNTAGAALWTIDYTLQAATLGISELHFHQGVGYKYNFFQPIALNRSTIDGSPLDPPTPPHIQAPFYAALVVNTLIGKTGSSEVVELNVDDENVSGYAAYEAGRLARAVFVNMHAWVSSSMGTRPVVHLDLASDFASTINATARRLVIQHADDVANLTWGGQSYENEQVQPMGESAAEVVVLGEGVDLRSTEAILLEF